MRNVTPAKQCPGGRLGAPRDDVASHAGSPRRRGPAGAERSSSSRKDSWSRSECGAGAARRLPVRARRRCAASATSVEVVAGRLLARSTLRPRAAAGRRRRWCRDPRDPTSGSDQCLAPVRPGSSPMPAVGRVLGASGRGRPVGSGSRSRARCSRRRPPGRRSAPTSRPSRRRGPTGRRRSAPTRRAAPSASAARPRRTGDWRGSVRSSPDEVATAMPPIASDGDQRAPPTSRPATSARLPRRIVLSVSVIAAQSRRAPRTIASELAGRHREGVARARVAGLEADLEPALARLRGAVGPRLLVAVAERVVADRGGGVRGPPAMSPGSIRPRSWAECPHTPA